MRKINKDLGNIPPSLDSDLTKQRWKELIAVTNYIDEGVYNSRYKTADIKSLLEAIYDNKCAFCEQQIEQFHVEHFRPKLVYYWLAYSWDNLLLCCASCNSFKGTKFEIEGTKAEIDTIDISEIHVLAEKYNELEQNKLINPEQEDISHLLDFEKNGKVFSKDNRVQYTIDTCQVSRIKVSHFRKQIYQDFEKKVMSKLMSGEKLDGFVEDFTKDCETKDFPTFRKYMLKHWLREII